MHPIKKACEIIGSQRKLADRLGVSPGFVSQWVTGVRQVPADYCPTIERLTNGAVKCEQMCPDVDWAYLRATDCPTAACTDKQAA